mgnify:CR=1 FL=1
MSRVRGKNTSPERKVFRFLRARKIYFRQHYNHTFGTPDIVLTDKKRAIFINGDFWHGRYYEKTKHKLTPFWREKIATNMARDKRNCSKLRREGWRVMNIWVGDLKKNEEKILNRIGDFLRLKH